MSKSKIISEVIRTQAIIKAQIRKEGRKIKRIGILGAILLALPIIARANASGPKMIEPLTGEQSVELASKINSLNPVSAAQEKRVEMVRIQEPEPEVQAPVEEPAQPAPSQAAAPTRRVAARRQSQQKPSSARTSAPRSAGSSANAVGSSWEQCVPFARELSGVQIRGYAGNIKPNSSDASVGSVALFSGYGHAAVVTGVDGDNVTIKEANYVPGQITERTVPKSQLRGYVK